MARKTVDVTVDLDGRDKGKVFRLTEMDAWSAEQWAMRALSVLGRSGVELPPAAMEGNMLVIAVFGLQALIQVAFDEAKPLLDQMMECAVVVPAPATEPNVTRRLRPNSDDVEDAQTLFWLRDRIMELHTGFSLAAVISKLQAQAAARASIQRPTRTSQKRLRS